mmetsp:Transcript_57643/g.160640  ORF Transcript_57643/g.160640 Transcript_57643/m.160640 type:complete len:233 (+) Transcript_57643:43-741(+)
MLVSNTSEGSHEEAYQERRRQPEAPRGGSIRDRIAGRVLQSRLVGWAGGIIKDARGGCAIDHRLARLIEALGARLEVVDVLALEASLYELVLEEPRTAAGVARRHDFRGADLVAVASLERVEHSHVDGIRAGYLVHGSLVRAVWVFEEEHAAVVAVVALVLVAAGVARGVAAPRVLVPRPHVDDQVHVGFLCLECGHIRDLRHAGARDNCGSKEHQRGGPHAAEGGREKKCA